MRVEVVHHLRLRRSPIVALVAMVFLILPSQALAAQWPDEFAMACDAGNLRRSFIFNPAVCQSISHEKFASPEFVNYFGTDRGRGSFDRNFLVWAPIIRAFNGNDQWTFCGTRDTQTNNFCPSNDIRTNPVSAAVGDGQITAKRWGGQFIGAYCGNYSPHAGTARGPIPRIRGTKFLDENRDGIRDGFDEGLEGWTIELYYNGNLVQTTTTAADGTYEFALSANGTSLREGSYQVKERQQDGFLQTAAPDPFFIPLGAADSIFEGKDFGNSPLRFLRGRAVALVVTVGELASHTVSDTGVVSEREDARLVTPKRIFSSMRSPESDLSTSYTQPWSCGVFLRAGPARPLRHGSRR